MGMTD